MKKKWSILMIAEGGIMIALSALLSYIQIYQAPNGGSVTAGSMIPLLVFAIRWGVGPGFVVGAAYGVLDFILKPYFFHPLQVFLDYPLAYGALGMAGLGYNSKKRGNIKELIYLILGIAVGIGVRMLIHILSGVVFFSEYAGDKNPWLYSLAYNVSYLIPEFIISVIVIVLMWKPLKKIVRKQEESR